MHTQETLEELEARLAPKRSYTPEQHEIARLRFVLDNLFDELSEIGLHLTRGETEKAQALTEDIREDVWKHDDVRHRSHDIVVKGLGERYHVHPMEGEVESGFHGGDCTACPCTCPRCHYETYYGVSTATFGKREGWRLFSRLNELAKQKETNND
jgi:hypothetical protein